MPTQPIGGLSLHYVERGQGVPLVLLHGFPLDHQMWQAQLADLSSRYRVIAPDLVGFGQSPSDAPFTMESQADAIRALLAEIGALPCVLGGLSMGGYIALAFAKKYAADLKGLILIDTRAEADSAQAKESRGKMIDLVRQKGAPAIAEQMIPRLLAPGAVAGRPSAAQHLKKMIEACPAKTIEHALAAMRDRPDSTDALASIKTPTLVIVGDGDQLTPPDVAASMQKAIPGAKLVEIHGAGHMTPMEQPAQVTQAIANFLAKIK